MRRGAAASSEDVRRRRVTAARTSPIDPAVVDDSLRSAELRVVESRHRSPSVQQLLRVNMETRSVVQATRSAPKDWAATRDDSQKDQTSDDEERGRGSELRTGQTLSPPRERITPKGTIMAVATEHLANGSGGVIDVLPPGFVPTPTPEYQAFHLGNAFVSGVLSRHPSAAPRDAEPEAAPPVGARVLMWKQDPTVAEIGIRKAFLPGQFLAGPRDARIVVQGLPPVNANALGDFIVSPADVNAFDAVHTFAVVRQTLTMYQRNRGGAPLPWQWNGPGNTAPINVFPHAGVTANAFYSRNEKALKFFFFTKAGDPPTALRSSPADRWTSLRTRPGTPFWTD